VVVKVRTRTEPATLSINGVAIASPDAVSVYEKMADSSETGSPRTEVDAVDRFLANPTNRGDFHAALRESYKTAGDAGLADFRVDRTRTQYGVQDLVLHGEVITSFENMMFTPSFTTGFPSVPDLPSLNQSQMRAAGQRLYHSALPNRSQAELGTAIAEIVSNPVRALTVPGSAALRAVERQGRSGKALQKRAQQRHRQIRGLPLEEARAAADDYLAYVFGVRPNVQTLDDLAESLSRSRRIAEEVSRTGMKRIRRRRAGRTLHVVDVNHTTGYSIALTNASSWGLADAVSHRFVENTQRTWWAGSFRMPVVDTDTWLDRCSDLFKTVDRLTGLGLDLRVAWDLVPFSFIADWFANTGDFLENRQVVADYNITCEYGYFMCHTRNTRTFIASGTFQRRSGSIPFYGTAPLSFRNERFTEVKQRTRCSSYGFYTDFDSLNAAQWASLVAIGLSQSAGVRPTTRS